MIDNEETPDDDLPLCSFDDMWSKPDKVAVVANNRKNALRVLDSKKEATDWRAVCLGKDKCKYKAGQLSLEFRPAIRTRCEHWCPVNIYCNQFNSYLKDMAVYNKIKGDK
jgi:hypothetical protein